MYPLLCFQMQHPLENKPFLSCVKKDSVVQEFGMLPLLSATSLLRNTQCTLLYSRLCSNAGRYGVQAGASIPANHRPLLHRTPSRARRRVRQVRCPPCTCSTLKGSTSLSCAPQGLTHLTPVLALPANVGPHALGNAELELSL